jgi:hypothetical protein
MHGMVMGYLDITNLHDTFMQSTSRVPKWATPRCSLRLSGLVALDLDFSFIGYEKGGYTTGRVRIISPLLVFE